jgi:hypothetical protein
MTRADPALLAQLNLNSEPYHDPLAEVDWAALSLDDYWLPPSALSLAGIPEFDALPEAMRVRLSQYEFVYFIHGGLWLERLFMERMVEALRKAGSPVEYASYLHEIREEAGHSLMFLKLMEKSGLHLPANGFRVPRLADFLGRHAPADSVLFLLALVIGEEVPDKLNRHVRAAGAHSVNPVIQRMSTLHIIDEARHIARARSMLESALERLGPVKRRLLAPVIAGLLRHFTRTLYLPQPAVYELSGLKPGANWQHIARTNPVRHTFVSLCVEPTLNLLRRNGFAIRVPTIE